jgi:polar amino acid transport system permease protein
MSFDWQWDYTFEILPILLVAAVNTVIATVVGYALALVIGVVFLIGQRTRYRILNRAVREIVEFVRTTPLIAQVFFVFYVAPEYGILLSPWTSGMMALGIHYGAYLSEVYRGALYTIPTQQWEACKALYLSPARTYLGVIPPQHAGHQQLFRRLLQGHASPCDNHCLRTAQRRQCTRSDDISLP